MGLRRILTLNILIFVFAYQANAAVTLHDVIEGAKQRMESIKKAEQLQDESLNLKRQAGGALLPTVKVIGSYMRQQELSSAGSTSVFVQPDQTTIRLNVAQPIFAGGKEYGELFARSREKEATDAAAENESRLVAMAASGLFFDTMALEKRKAIQKKLLDIEDRRKKEIQARIRIGRSRPAELLALENQTKKIESQLEDIESKLYQNRLALHSRSGVGEQEEMIDSFDVPKDLPAISQMETKLKDRGDLKNLRLKTEAADDRKWVSRSGYFPTADLSGNYYFKRPGVSKDISWDVTLNFSVPLFDGFRIYEDSLAASARWKQAEIEEQRASREALLELTQLHLQTKSLLKQYELLQEATKAATENFQAVDKEFRLGLVTHLEVLTALNDMAEAENQRDVTYYEYKKAYFNLLYLSKGEK